MARYSWRNHRQHDQVSKKQEENCQDVCGDHQCVRDLLAPLPRLLHLFLPQPRYHEVPPHQEYLPRLLLACHGQLCGQSNCELISVYKLGTKSFKLYFQIYYWMGNRFRKYFNQLIYLRCLKSTNIDPAQEFVQDHERLRHDSVPLTNMTSPSLLSRKSHSVYLRNASICKKINERNERCTPCRISHKSDLKYWKQCIAIKSIFSHFEAF